MVTNTIFGFFAPFSVSVKSTRERVKTLPRPVLFKVTNYPGRCPFLILKKRMFSLPQAIKEFGKASLKRIYARSKSHSCRA